MLLCPDPFGCTTTLYAEVRLWALVWQAWRARGGRT